MSFFFFSHVTFFIHSIRWNWVTLLKFQIAQTCLQDLGADKMTLQVLLTEKWWVHCCYWKNSAKSTALTLGQISTKIMRSVAIWRYLYVKNFATWRKIPENGNTLKDEALFIGTLHKRKTKPYNPKNTNFK